MIRSLGLNCGVRMTHDTLPEKLNAVQSMGLIDFVLELRRRLFSSNSTDHIFSLVIAAAKGILDHESRQCKTNSADLQHNAIDGTQRSQIALDCCLGTQTAREYLSGTTFSTALLSALRGVGETPCWT